MSRYYHNRLTFNMEEGRIKSLLNIGRKFPSGRFENEDEIQFTFHFFMARHKEDIWEDRGYRHIPIVYQQDLNVTKDEVTMVFITNRGTNHDLAEYISFLGGSNVKHTYHSEDLVCGANYMPHASIYATNAKSISWRGHLHETFSSQEDYDDFYSVCDLTMHDVVFKASLNQINKTLLSV